MNIAVCINTLSSGGGESFASSIALAYKNLGHNVIVVIYAIHDDKGRALYRDLINAGITVINFDRRSKSEMFSYPLKLSRIFKQYNIDLVHSHLEQMDLLVTLSRLFNQRKTLYIRTLHSMVAMPQFPIWLHKWLFKRFDYSIGCGDSLVQTYSIETFRNKIIPINNGILYKDYSEEEIKEIRTRIRQKLNIPDEEFVFLQIGRFKPVLGELCKGHDLTFNAVMELDININFRIVFIGEDSDKTNSKLYSQKALKDKRLVFVGIVDNPIDYILACDCILAPSRVEGLPISSLEAAGYGKPLLCSQIKAFDIFKQDSVMRINPFNSSEFANKMVEMMTSYSDINKNAINNIDFYRDNFSIKKTAQQYLHIIHISEA